MHGMRHMPYPELESQSQSTCDSFICAKITVRLCRAIYFTGFHRTVLHIAYTVRCRWRRQFSQAHAIIQMYLDRTDMYTDSCAQLHPHVHISLAFLAAHFVTSYAIDWQCTICMCVVFLAGFDTHWAALCRLAAIEDGIDAIGMHSPITDAMTFYFHD